MTDILPAGSDKRRREIPWRWLGIVAIGVGMVLWHLGQAPNPTAHGNIALAGTGVLLALAGCVVTLISFRRARRNG